MSKRELACTALTFTLLLSVGAGPSQNASSAKHDLLTPVTLPPPGVPNDSAVVKSRDVLVKVELLRGTAGKRVLIPTFGNEVLTVLLNRREEPSPDRLFWYGRIENDPGGEVTLSVNKKVLVGGISTGHGKIYQIRYLRGPYHRLQEIARSKLPPETDSTVVPVHTLVGQAGTCSTDPPTDIDVLVVYTQAAGVGAGGADAMEALIAGAIESTNQSYINSGIEQRLRLVHIEEVSFVETESAPDNLDRLKNDPEVQTIRNAFGADVVVLFTRPMDACGRSHTPSVISPSNEKDAYAVVGWDCESGNYTFGHELGHMMYARHPWGVDTSNNEPFHDNHGYNRLSPSDPALTPWATMMSIETSCDTCRRILYWSNPDVTFPPGSAQADPTGEYSNDLDQPTDNARVLNATALTVANYRCSSSPVAADVWMKDTWDDTGSEPDPNAAFEDMWNSPYIWVRNTQDSEHKYAHEHQNPAFGSTNWIYVKLHNGASSPLSGTLETYEANASVSIDWPDGWTKIGDVQISDFAPKSTQIAEQEWANVPARGHFCLLARWVSSSDPMKFTEGSDINSNVANNNNLIWRNVDIVDLATSSTQDDTFYVKNPSPSATPVSLEFRWSDSRRASFLKFGEVSVKFDDSLLTAWQRGGGRGEGFVRTDYGFRIGEKGAQFEQIRLDSRASGRVFVRMRCLPTTPRRVYGFDAVETTKARTEGGITYEIRTGKSAY